MAGRTYGERNLNSFVVSCFLLPWAPAHKQLSSSGCNWGTPERLLPSMSWRLHFPLLSPRTCCPSWWGFFCPYPSLCQGSGQWTLWARVRHLADFLVGCDGESSACSSHFFFLPSFSSSPPGLEPGQNPQCLASGPHEARALMFHWENSVRDTAIGKRWTCQIQRESHSTGGGPSQRRGQWPWTVVQLAFAGWVISYANEWEDHSNN